MKTAYYKIFIFLVLLELCSSAFTNSLFANQINKQKSSGTMGTMPILDDKLEINKQDNKNNILILADKFTSDQKTGCAIFTGNVKATLKNNVLTCGQLKIFYNKDSNNKNNKDSSMNSVGQSAKKIIAEKNVYILFDKNIAESDKAVYTTLTEILVLTGKNAKLTTETDYISGSKITYNKKDARIFVEKGLNKQIEALIYQNNR